MLEFILSLWAAVRVFFRSRADVAPEALALRQQLAVLKRKRPRPPSPPLDRLFRTTLRHPWSHWPEVPIVVKPETVVAWHRADFQLFWRWRSRSQPGRPKMSDEIRTPIRRLAEENAGWGAPKIHGELQKLGFVASERSVARYLRRIRRRSDPAARWLTFLRNHREAIVAFDFFTVPAITIELLYRFFAIEHGRRKILHCNVTRHPSAERVVQPLREAFPEAAPYRYVILDRDSKFDAEVVAFLKATGLDPKRTGVQSPRQNGIAERWVGSCRREILDHVIALNEEHLRRPMRDYVNYHHQDRIHDSLEKNTPNRRPIEQKPSAYAMVISNARLGGLHHRYCWREAAQGRRRTPSVSGICLHRRRQAQFRHPEGLRAGTEDSAADRCAPQSATRGFGGRIGTLAASASTDAMPTRRAGTLHALRIRFWLPTGHSACPT